MTNMVKAGHLGGNIEGGDQYTFEQKVWSWLVDKYSVKTVLDVGCGEGQALMEFKRLGCDVVGIDGLKRNAVAIDKLPIVVNDFEWGGLFVGGIDLVWCCEVVEHVHEQFLDGLIETLKSGRVVAMTFSTSRRGWHHVNVKDGGYWIGKMEAAGFRLNVLNTIYAREISEWHLFKGTGLVFDRIDT